MSAKESKPISPHFIEDAPLWMSPDGSWGVRGLTRGSMRTGFIGEGILRDVFFEAGVSSCHRRPRALLLTHVHVDHAAALPDLCTHLPGQFDVFAPLEAIAPLKMFLVGSAAIADSTPTPVLREDGVPKRYNVRLIGVTEGDQHSLGFGGLRVRVHSLRHTSPCVGYVITQDRNVLRKELHGLNGAEIAERREAGEEVSDVISVPLLGYFGDTDTAGLAEALGNELRAFPEVVFTECTWLMHHEIDAKHRHSEWNLLKPIILSAPQTTFVLIHFSRRNSDSTICEFFATVPENLPNIILWLETGPVHVKQMRK